MPIIAASVEGNGWVLRLDVSGSPGSFASYTFDPDGSPRITLASNHAGFSKSGGQAVPDMIARSLIGTKPLRKPVVWASGGIQPFVVDETDLGGGVIRVRIALSEHVYATDTSLSLAVLADWRTGENAASSIAVTNNSTIAAPIPIFRWALAPYEVTTGAFRVSLLVFSHHANGFEPVAGVRFTTTDGTNTKTVWATQLGTDNSYADNLRCYTAIIDPATATALTAGLLRCDAEVYPWLGAMRTTDTAGTRSMATLRTDGYSVNAASPWVIGYDPAGTRYSQMWAFVDPVNGTATASAAMVATTLAGAKAVAPASRPISVNTAVQAGYLVNRTLPAANGQASQTRSIDGMNVVLAAGTHVGLGATAVTTGLATPEIPARVVGDPENANPRANVILQTASNGTSRVSRYRWQNLTIEQGTNLLAGTVTVYNHIDNIILRGKAGQEANAVSPFAAGAPVGQWNLCATRSRIWRTGNVFGSGNARIGLFRGNAHSRNLTNYLVALRNRLISSAEDGFVGTGALSSIYPGWTAPTLAGQAEDLIVFGNDMRFLRGPAWSPSRLPAAIAGTPNPSMRRHVFAGNVCERIGNDPQPFYNLGEKESLTQSYNIIEGNTMVGERSNTFYNDPLPTTLAQVDVLTNQAFVNRVANNAFDWLPSKHDAFSDPDVQALRGSSNGTRPHLVDAWSMLYGVMHEGNVITQRAAPAVSTFALEFPGLRSVGFETVIDPLYTDDNSVDGPDGAIASGGGDYRPAAASPLAGRAMRGNGDVDADGLMRRQPYAAGAFQAVAVALAPGSARSQGGATAATIGWVATLLPAFARQSPSGATIVGWSATLAIASGRIAVATADVSLAWAGSLPPATARHTITVAAPQLNVTIAVVPLGVERAAMAHRAARSLLLGDDARAAGTLIVGADPRFFVPTRN